MTHRTPLTADEEAAWLDLYTLALCLPGLLDQQLRRDAGLGHYEYAVLHALHRAPAHTLTMAELSELTSSSFSRLSHTITRLEKRELVERRRRGANRHVTLTAAGRRAFLSAAAGHMDEIRRRVLDHVPDKRLADLSELLRPIAESLRAELDRG